MVVSALQATCSCAPSAVGPSRALRPASHTPKSAFFVGTSIKRASVSASTAPARKVTQMGLFGLGLPELAVIGIVGAVVFGPSKLPELGKAMGKTVKSFQSAAKEFEEELKAEGADAKVTEVKAVDADAKPVDAKPVDAKPAADKAPTPPQA